MADVNYSSSVHGDSRLTSHVVVELMFKVYGTLLMQSFRKGSAHLCGGNEAGLKW